jgi:hypothetical protein
MARNPRFVTLFLMCDAEGAVVTLVPGLGSRYELVPFRPASYTIAPAMKVVDAIPGTFAAQAMLRMPPSGKVERFQPTGFGKLIITDFDYAHVAGRFEFTAASGPKQIGVKGVFDYKRPPAAATAVPAGANAAAPVPPPKAAAPAPSR